MFKHVSDLDESDSKGKGDSLSKCQFNFMDMLGDSFIRDNYKDFSEV